MKFISIFLVVLLPFFCYGQQITYPVTDNGNGTFDLQKKNDINNSTPVPVLDFETVSSDFLRNYYFSELIQSQDQLAENAYNGIVRNQQTNKILQGLNANLFITEEMVKDSLQARHLGRLNGNWRYNVIGQGGVDVTISNDTIYLGGGAVWATFQNWGAKRIEVFLVHPSVGPDTLFLNTPTGALWAGQTPEEAFHALRHRPIDEN